MEVMISSLLVCLSVSNFVQKIPKGFFCMKFSEKIGNGPMNKRLNIGDDQDPYCDTGKTCLG